MEDEFLIPGIRELTERMLIIPATITGLGITIIQEQVPTGIRTGIIIRTQIQTGKVM